MQQKRSYGDSLKNKHDFTQEWVAISVDIGKRDWNAQFETSVEPISLEQLSYPTQLKQSIDAYKLKRFTPGRTNYNALLGIFNEQRALDGQEEREASRKKRGNMSRKEIKKAIAGESVGTTKGKGKKKGKGKGKGEKKTVAKAAPGETLLCWRHLCAHYSKSRECAHIEKHAGCDRGRGCRYDHSKLFPLKEFLEMRSASLRHSSLVFYHPCLFRR